MQGNYLQQVALADRTFILCFLQEIGILEK